jgi:hypothetical protein
VLNDAELLIALRGESLNVYWQGQSLFRVQPGTSGLKVTTHEKYLIDPTLASQVELADGAFNIDGLIPRGFLRPYQGKATLAKMKTAAAYYAGDEKRGCHRVALNRANAVIDIEIAFPGLADATAPDDAAPTGAGGATDGADTYGETEGAGADGGTGYRPGRIDLASLLPDGDNIRLVVWEAKLYGNPDLRTALRGKNEAAVCTQVRRYNTYLTDHWDSLCNDYEAICRNLVSLGDMGWKREIPKLVRQVAGGTRLLRDQGPKIGLLVFGRDEANRDHWRWQAHLERLETWLPGIPIRVCGDARDIRL